MGKRLTYRLMAAIIACLTVNQGYSQHDTLYFPDGSVKAVGTLFNGLKSGKWTSYYAGGAIRSEGTFRNGFKVGNWTWYHENGQVSSQEIWNAGIYEEGAYWDKDGNPSDIREVLTQATYPGGMEAFTGMISDRILYPEQVMDRGGQGRVVLEFTITAGGRLVNPVVIENAHPELTEEALRVVQLSDTWMPATFHDQRIPAKYKIPIVFSLN